MVLLWRACCFVGLPGHEDSRLLWWRHRWRADTVKSRGVPARGTGTGRGPPNTGEISSMDLVGMQAVSRVASLLLYMLGHSRSGEQRGTGAPAGLGRGPPELHDDV